MVFQLLQLISNELIGLRNKQVAVRAEIKRVERELEPIEKEINCIGRPQEELYCRRKEIYFSIFK